MPSEPVNNKIDIRTGDVMRCNSCKKMISKNKYIDNFGICDVCFTKLEDDAEEAIRDYLNS